MTKTVSARIPNKSHVAIIHRCNKAGCTINEWLNAGIDYLITGSTDFDFGDEEDDEPSEMEPEPLREKELTPNIQDEDKFKSHYDSHGNYYTYDKDRKIWTCHLNLDNARITCKIGTNRAKNVCFMNIQMKKVSKLFL